MAGKRKVTYTLIVDDLDDDKSVGRKLISRRIRSIAIRQGECMADWARELGVSRSMIHLVVTGRRPTGYIRDFIETRLNTIFWEKAKTGEKRP